MVRTPCSTPPSPTFTAGKGGRQIHLPTQAHGNMDSNSTKIGRSTGFCISNLLNYQDLSLPLIITAESNGKSKKHRKSSTKRFNNRKRNRSRSRTQGVAVVVGSISCAFIFVAIGSGTGCNVADGACSRGVRAI